MVDERLRGVGFGLVLGLTTVWMGGFLAAALATLVGSVGAVMAAVGVLLDYRGWRRFAFWPHVVSLWLVSWGVFIVIDSETLAFVVLAVLGLAFGIWLARLAHIAFGAVAGWSAISVSAEGGLFPLLLMRGLPSPQGDPGY